MCPRNVPGLAWPVQTFLAFAGTATEQPFLAWNQTCAWWPGTSGTGWINWFQGRNVTWLDWFRNNRTRPKLVQKFVPRNYVRPALIRPRTPLVALQRRFRSVTTSYFIGHRPFCMLCYINHISKQPGSARNWPGSGRNKAARFENSLGPASSFVLGGSPADPVVAASGESLMDLLRK